MKTLVVDGVKYFLSTPKDEEQLEEMVKKCAKEVFGEKSIYFDIKHIIVSKAGIGSIPDGYVIDFTDMTNPRWYIVEIELSSHPLYDHIVKQLNKFINGIKNLEAQKEIVEALYQTICENRIVEGQVKEFTQREDAYPALMKIIAKQPKIVVISEKVSEEVKEVCANLKHQPITIEFETYVRENAPTIYAHLFEPLYKAKEVSEPTVVTKKPIPEHYKDWETMLQWVNQNVREIVNELTNNNILQLPNVKMEEHGRYRCFYKGKPSTKSIFTVFLLTKKALKVRIRTDPATFKDPQKWTGDKIYKGWFFKQGQEREFKMSDKGQIVYAMELIKQSYEITGEKKESTWKKIRLVGDRVELETSKDES